jgi:hypothetical protein
MLATAVSGKSAPLKISCAEPQSDAPEGAPRAAHKLAKVGVVIDAIDPSIATQFRKHRTPPSVAFKVSGKRIPGAATRIKCAVPKTDTENDGVVPEFRAEETSEESAACAGEHIGIDGDDHTIVEVFWMKMSTHCGYSDA